VDSLKAAVYNNASTTLNEDLTVVKWRILVFWDVTPCNLIKVYKYVAGTYCLHLQGGRSKKPAAAYFRWLLACLTFRPRTWRQYVRPKRHTLADSSSTSDNLLKPDGGKERVGKVKGVHSNAREVGEKHIVRIWRFLGSDWSFFW
jgi:hypothetical protein